MHEKELDIIDSIRFLENSNLQLYNYISRLALAMLVLTAIVFVQGTYLVFGVK